MSTPMYDLPTHFPVDVDANGSGPVAQDDPRFDHTECWCADPDCELWRQA